MIFIGVTAERATKIGLDTQANAKDRLAQAIARSYIGEGRVKPGVYIALGVGSLGEVADIQAAGYINSKHQIVVAPKSSEFYQEVIDLELQVRRNPVQYVDTPTELEGVRCKCGCGQVTKHTNILYLPQHDMARLHRVIKENFGSIEEALPILDLMLAEHSKQINPTRR